MKGRGEVSLVLRESRRRGQRGGWVRGKLNLKLKMPSAREKGEK